MTDEKTTPADAETFEVVQLETDDGESTEFVILEKVEIDNHTYALMALLEIMEQMADMSDDEFEKLVKEDGLIHIMRIEGEHFEEIGEEEFNQIEHILEDKIANLFDGDEE